MDREGPRPIRQGQQPVQQPVPENENKGELKLGLGKESHVVTHLKADKPPPKELPAYSFSGSVVKEFVASQNVPKFKQLIAHILTALKSFFGFKSKAPAKTAEAADHSRVLQEAMSGGNKAEGFIALFRGKGKKEAIVKQAVAQFEEVKAECQKAQNPDVDKLLRAFLVKEAAQHFSNNPPTEATDSLMGFTIGNLTSGLINLSNKFKALRDELSLPEDVSVDPKQAIMSALSERKELVPQVPKVDHTEAFDQAAKGNPVPILESMKKGKPEEAVRVATEQYSETKATLLASLETPKELDDVARKMELTLRFGPETSYTEKFCAIGERIAVRRAELKERSAATGSAVEKLETQIEAAKRFLGTYEGDLAKVNREITGAEMEIAKKEDQIRELEATLEANISKITRLSKKGGAEKNKAAIESLSTESNQIQRVDIPGIRASIAELKNLRRWDELQTERQEILQRIDAQTRNIEEWIPEQIAKQIEILRSCDRELDLLTALEGRLQGVASAASGRLTAEQLKGLLISFARKEAVTAYQGQTGLDPQAFWNAQVATLSIKFREELWSMGIAPKENYNHDFYTL